MSKHPDTTACRSSWINPVGIGTETESWYCQDHKEAVWPNKGHNMVTNSSDDNNGVLEPPSSLHTKLQTILIAYGTTVKHEAIINHTPEAIAQILQAFQEAGYVKTEQDVEVKGNVLRLRDLHLMTGQVFLDRFKTELPQEFDGTGQPERKERWYWESSVLEAARRAAGVSDDQ